MVRAAFLVLEILVLTALILATRCANYQDVFFDGNIYFTDADCYARMSRVRICAEHPGTIVRHHDFENFPQGTSPHTTAPLDYLILGLAMILKPFTSQSIDLAGAFISPVLALLGGWFLWWWSRRMQFQYRWVLLILYAISPILVHGTELGRPDHQSLLMLLITIGVCAEWKLRANAGGTPASIVRWGVVSGSAWGLAFWVSLYEPLVLLALLLIFSLTKDRNLVFGPHRRIGWVIFGVILVLALSIERRIPFSLSFFQSDSLFAHWSQTIGELVDVPPFSRIWFVWAGYLIVVAPILIWFGRRTRLRSAPARQESSNTPIFMIGLLIATYGLTIWQARWSYFFLSIFALSLPALLAPIKSRAAVWTAFVLSIFPLLQFWDAKLWPNEAQLSARVERQNESRDLRELAMMIRSDQTHPFLAPWWLSPSIAYWSGQPGIAGSSHQSLNGIRDSAQFFLAGDSQSARDVLQKRGVDWIFAYDWDRIAQNSVQLLGGNISDHATGRILDRNPAAAPAYLVLSGQNRTAKLFRFVDKL